MRWKIGEPPKDGQKYEMARRVENAGGYWTTVDWATPGWWDGKTYVQRNQMTGGTRYVHAPNRWREYRAENCMPHNVEVTGKPPRGAAEAR